MEYRREGEGGRGKRGVISQPNHTTKLKSMSKFQNAILENAGTMSPDGTTFLDLSRSLRNSAVPLEVIFCFLVLKNQVLQVQMFCDFILTCLYFLI